MRQNSGTFETFLRSQDQLNTPEALRRSAPLTLTDALTPEVLPALTEHYGTVTAFPLTEGSRKV